MLTWFNIFSKSSLAIVPLIVSMIDLDLKARTIVFCMVTIVLEPFFFIELSFMWSIKEDMSDNLIVGYVH